MIVPCYFCKRKVDRDECICLRCGEIICWICDKNSAPEGPHTPQAHLQYPKEPSK